MSDTEPMAKPSSGARPTTPREAPFVVRPARVNRAALRWLKERTADDSEVEIEPRKDRER